MSCPSPAGRTVHKTFLAELPQRSGDEVVLAAWVRRLRVPSPTTFVVRQDASGQMPCAAATPALAPLARADLPAIGMDPLLAVADTTVRSCGATSASGRCSGRRRRGSRGSALRCAARNPSRMDVVDDPETERRHRAATPSGDSRAGGAPARRPSPRRRRGAGGVRPAVPRARIHDGREAPAPARQPRGVGPRPRHRPGGVRRPPPQVRRGHAAARGASRDRAGAPDGASRRSGERARGRPRPRRPDPQGPVRGPTPSPVASAPRVLRTPGRQNPGSSEPQVVRTRVSSAVAPLRPGRPGVPAGPGVGGKLKGRGAIVAGERERARQREPQAGASGRPEVLGRGTATSCRSRRTPCRSGTRPRGRGRGTPSSRRGRRPGPTGRSDPTTPCTCRSRCPSAGCR